MIEQQYTCPFCLEDYTRLTIQDHYACGVTPLEEDAVLVNANMHVGEIVEAIAQKRRGPKPKAITEEVIKDAPKKRGRKPKIAINF